MSRFPTLVDRINVDIRSLFSTSGQQDICVGPVALTFVFFHFPDSFSPTFYVMIIVLGLRLVLTLFYLMAVTLTQLPIQLNNLDAIK